MQMNEFELHEKEAHFQMKSLTIALEHCKQL